MNIKLLAELKPCIRGVSKFISCARIYLTKTFYGNNCYPIAIHGENMVKFDWRPCILRCGFKIAIALFLLWVTLSIIGILGSLDFVISSQFSNLFLSVGFGVLTLTFGVISLRIYLESDQLLRSIATGDFYEFTYRFWDRASFLYEERKKGERDTQSWQLGNLFRHAEKLKKWADPDVQEQLIKEFKIFLGRLRPTACIKYWVEVKNYKTICKIAIGFKTENDDIKDKLIDELGNWIGKKERAESNQEYLERKDKKKKKKKNYDIFT